MIITGISILALCGIAGFTYWYTRDTHIVRIKKNEIMEFKTSMELSGLPIIVFAQGEEKYNFLLDTGSNVSYVNATSGLKVDKLDTKETFIGANGTDLEAHLATISLERRGSSYNCIVRVADLSKSFSEVKISYGIQLSGILGNDFFTKYKYCLDFKELVCYVRK